VEVGAYAFVGAGSVVTRSLPERVLAMGVPARVVRSLD
jgi:maltose O-acetyltransferase